MIVSYTPKHVLNRLFSSVSIVIVTIGKFKTYYVKPLCKGTGSLNVTNSSRCHVYVFVYCCDFGFIVINQFPFIPFIQS